MDQIKAAVDTFSKGDIDFKKTFSRADPDGLKYFFCEQDNANGLEDVTTSYNNIKKLL